MTEHIESGAIKVIELIGVSQESFEDAVRRAVGRASASLDGVNGIEVVKFSAKITDKQISEYHANVKVAFVVK